MAKPTITTRAGKGSALTWTEGDTNLTNLRDATITIKADTGGTDVVSDLNGTVTLVAGSNVTITGDNTAKTVSISAAAGGATNLDGLSDVSLTSPSSNQVLTYNGSTWINQSPSSGALDDLSDVTITSPSNGQALVYNSSTFQWTNQTVSGSGITDVVQDTTPQLGGDLDVNGKIITSSGGVNIVLEPNGTGDVYLNSDTVRIGDQNANATLTTYGTGDLILSTNEGTSSGTITIGNGANGNITVEPNGTGDVYINADTLRLGDTGVAATFTTNGAGNLTLSTNSGTNSGTITITQGANANISITPNGNGNIVLDGLTWPNTDGTADYFLKTNGGGILSWGNRIAESIGVRQIVSTTNATFYPWFSSSSTSAATITPNYATTFTYNPSTQVLTVGTVNGAHNGTVGATTPSTGAFTTLSASGAVTLSSTLSAGGSNGTSGQVLQSTGSGIQWATPSATTNKIVLASSDTTGRFTLANTNDTASTSTFTLVTAGGVSGVSVSTNTFTLPAGTYYFYVPGLVTTSYNSPDRRCNIKLYNSTDAAATQTWGNFQSITLGGVTAYTWNNLTAYFTIAGSKTFQIRTASIPTGSSSSTAPVITHNNESTGEKFMFFIEKVA